MASYGKTSGFNEVNSQELLLVNGGKGDSGGSSSDEDIIGYTGEGGTELPIYSSPPQEDGVSVGFDGVTIVDDDTTVNIDNESATVTVSK
jgi:hypothetical protein